MKNNKPHLVLTTLWTAACFIVISFLLVKLLYYQRFRLGLVSAAPKPVPSNVTHSKPRPVKKRRGKVSAVAWFKLPVNQITAVAFSLWLALLLDTASWMLIWPFASLPKSSPNSRHLDGTWMFFTGFGEALLLGFWVTRLDISFRRFVYEYSENFFRLCYFVIFCYICAHVVIGAAHMLHSWRLVLWSTVATGVVLPLMTVCITYMFAKPLSTIARRQGDDRLLALAIKSSILSGVALGSSVLLKVLLISWYCSCSICAVSFVYFWLASVDKIVNVFCLLCTIKEGRHYYKATFGRVERCLLALVMNFEDTEESLTVTQCYTALDETIE